MQLGGQSCQRSAAVDGQAIWRGATSRAGNVEGASIAVQCRGVAADFGAPPISEIGKAPTAQTPACRARSDGRRDYVVQIAAAAGVWRIALTHDDPGHDDRFIADIEGRARSLALQRGMGLEVFPRL